MQQSIPASSFSTTSLLNQLSGPSQVDYTNVVPLTTYVNSNPYANNSRLGEQFVGISLSPPVSKPSVLSRYGSSIVDHSGSLLSGVVDFVNPFTIPEQLSAAYRELPNDYRKAKRLVSDPGGYLSERANVGYQLGKDRLTTAEGLGKTTVDAAAFMLIHKFTPAPASTPKASFYNVADTGIDVPVRGPQSPQRAWRKASWLYQDGESKLPESWIHRELPSNVRSQ